MATLSINIPDGLLAALGETPEARTGFILEAVAVDCFQTRQWSTSACAKLMGISRVEFIAIQMKRGIPDNLTGEDMVDGYEAINKITK